MTITESGSANCRNAFCCRQVTIGLVHHDHRRLGASQIASSELLLLTAKPSIA
jgi:hypothetical protein